MTNQICEEQNEFYKITPYKMKNDDKIENVKLPLPQAYNFFMFIVGKPNSGKSTLWLNLINKQSSKTLYKKFDKVFIFSNSIQTIQQEIFLPPEQLYHGIDELFNVVENIKQDEESKVLIVIDDCMSDFKENEKTLIKMIANRRHTGGGVSIILTTQVYNKVPLPVRKMVTDLVLFSTANKKEIKCIFEEYSQHSKDVFESIIQHCFKAGSHEFLYLKVESETYYHNFNPITLE